MKISFLKASHNTFTSQACIHDIAFLAYITELPHHHLPFWDSFWVLGKQRGARKKQLSGAAEADQYYMNVWESKVFLQVMKTSCNVEMVRQVANWDCCFVQKICLVTQLVLLLPGYSHAFLLVFAAHPRHLCASLVSGQVCSVTAIKKY